MNGLDIEFGVLDQDQLTSELWHPLSPRWLGPTTQDGGLSSLNWLEPALDTSTEMMNFLSESPCPSTPSTSDLMGLTPVSPLTEPQAHESDDAERPALPVYAAVYTFQSETKEDIPSESSDGLSKKRVRSEVEESRPTKRPQLGRHTASRRKVAEELSILRELVGASDKDTKAQVLHTAIDKLRQQEREFQELTSTLEARRVFARHHFFSKVVPGPRLPFVLEEASTPIGTVLHRPNSTLHSLNKLALQIGGYKSLEHFYSIPMHSRMHPSENDVWPKVHHHLMTTEHEPITFTKMLHHAKGFWFAAIAQAWSFKQNGGVRIVLLLHPGAKHVDDIPDHAMGMLEHAVQRVEKQVEIPAMHTMMKQKWVMKSD